MAKGKVPSSAKTLASMVKNYRRMRRSLLEASPAGANPELAELLQRKEVIARELKELRAKLAAAKRKPKRAAVPDDPTLVSLRESILLMSRNLAIPVELD